VSHDVELRASSVRSLGEATSASLGLSAFARRTRDAIVWFPGNFSWSPTNAPVERARGLEVHAAATGLARELDAWAAVYDARLRIGTLVVPTPYVPRAAAGATLAVTRGQWTARVRLAATGRRPFANAPADRSLELPGTLLASAAAGYRVRPLRALLFLAADNLGDVPWESVRRYPSPGRTWSAGLTIDP
jgi:outer membrane cobalamin receptor